MSRYPHPADMNPDSSDPRSPYYDDSRDEWIAERADELVEERMSSHESLTDAVEEVIGFSDWTDYLAGDMATVLMDEALAAEAVRFFSRLYKRVEQDIRDAAEADAESERDRWEEEQEEMRSGADLRGGAA